MSGEPGYTAWRRLASATPTGTAPAVTLPTALRKQTAGCYAVVGGVRLPLHTQVLALGLRVLAGRAGLVQPSAAAGAAAGAVGGQAWH